MMVGESLGENSSRIVIERSRMSHGESKLLTVLGARLARAQRDFDPDGTEEALNKVDEILSRIIVAVPGGWLPKGVTVKTPNWLDQLSEDHYEAVLEEVRTSPQKKGD